MSRNTRSLNWVLTSRLSLPHSQFTDIENLVENYVKDERIRFGAYQRLETQEYRVYCVFATQVGRKTAAALFPSSVCVPVRGLLSHDEEYCSFEFVKVGKEPTQGRRNDLKKKGGIQYQDKKTSVGGHSSDGVGVVGDLKKELEPEASERSTQGMTDLRQELEASKRETHVTLGMMEDLKQELEASKRETQGVMDDLKQELEASKRETQGVMDDLKQELEASKRETRAVKDDLNHGLDTAACSFVDHIKHNFNHVSKKNLRNTLREIYRLHPPLCARWKLLEVVDRYAAGPFKGYETEGSIVKMFNQARMHYHPDKQVGGGIWHKTVCVHLSKLLNNMIDHVKSDDVDKPMP
jgi:hypothetical protein